MLPSRFAATALESGPSFTKDRRYSIQGEFGAIYFSGSPDLAQREATEHGGEDLEPVTSLAYELTVGKMVDLTQKQTRRALGVGLDELVKSRIALNRYEVTQQIARRVYAGHFSGIIAPSIHDPESQNPDWFNVVLYPAHLLRSCLRRWTK